MSLNRLLDAEQMKAWVTTQEGVRSCPGGERRAAGLGGAGHGADVQTGAARAGLVSLRGCDSRGETLLWDHTYWWWKSPTGLSCLSPQRSCRIGPLMCIVFPGGCFLELVVPGSGRYSPLLLSPWFPSAASHRSLGTRHEAFACYVFPR